MAKNSHKPASRAGGLSRPKRARVPFEINRPDARAVFVTGSFNNWDPAADPLQRQEDGLWTTELRLPPGTYEYRFVVDGRWMMDPMSVAAVPNSFGGMNSIVVVPATL